jgi:Putative transposase
VERARPLTALGFPLSAHSSVYAVWEKPLGRLLEPVEDLGEDFDHVADVVARQGVVRGQRQRVVRDPVGAGESAVRGAVLDPGEARALQAASCAYRIAFGPRAGQKVLSLRSLPSAVTASAPELRVNAHGFSLHAAVRWRADQRKELEQLCRYISRPAIANERLKRNRSGQAVLQLKSPYKDGTTHVVMEPLEFMERLAALVPRPRLHLIRFHGVLAPQRQVAQ